MAKKELLEVFPDATTHNSDVWVADYTEQFQRKSHRMTAAERTLLKTGVHIQDFVFNDIDSFHLENRKGIEVLAVNFEHHKQNRQIFPSGKCDCECMFRVKEVHKGWVLLCELKYCLEKQKNREDHALKAHKQLSDTWEILNQHVRIEKQCKVYLNLSFPGHSKPFPFSSFMKSQSDMIDDNSLKRVIWLGENELLVVSEGQLIIPDVDI